MSMRRGFLAASGALSAQMLGVGAVRAQGVAAPGTDMPAIAR